MASKKSTLLGQTQSPYFSLDLNGISLFTETRGRNSLVSKIEDENVRKQVAIELAYILRDKVSEFVPEDTGKLKRKGYTVKGKEIGGVKARSILRYRNTTDVPYVMYQYRGIVYGPNFAQFDANGKQIPGAWKSPNSKHRQTKYPIGVERTVELRDGKLVHITGYTKNKNAHKEWMEYVRNTPTIWVPLRNEMSDYVKLVYKSIITEQKVAEIRRTAKAKAEELKSRRHGIRG